MAIIDIEAMERAIQKIEQMPDEFRSELSENIEKIKNEFISDINIVNQEIKKQIDEAKEDVSERIDFERDNCFNAFADMDKKLEEALAKAGKSTCDILDDAQQRIIKDMEDFKSNVANIIEIEVKKQLNLGNILKCIFGLGKTKE